MSAASDSESDWSSSENESVIERTTIGTPCSVEYKGVTYSGKSCKVSDDVPSDIVTFKTSDNIAVWCRDPGDGDLIALSRSECRKLATDIIGKTAKADVPTASDIAACGVSFGTPFPVQMKSSTVVHSDTATKSEKQTGADSDESDEVVTFKYNKQQLTGKKISLTRQLDNGPEITAVEVESKNGTGGDVYWVVASSSDSAKKVAMTVTDAKRAVKSFIRYAIGTDGPTKTDDEKCKDACGTPCPTQLHDARARNERAKQKRAVAPTNTLKRKAVEPPGDVVDKDESVSEKKEETELSPLKKERLMETKPSDDKKEPSIETCKSFTETKSVDQPDINFISETNVSVTLTGNASTLLPMLSSVFKK